MVRHPDRQPLCVAISHRNAGGTVENVIKRYRPSWDDYYLDIAKAVSARGDCVRAQHGCVIVKDNSIISTGYNGTPAGDPRSCGAAGQCPRALDAGSEHAKGDYDLCWSTHAESNALLRASWSLLQDSTVYITGRPCAGCTKLLKSSNVARVVWRVNGITEYLPLGR